MVPRRSWSGLAGASHFSPVWDPVHDEVNLLIKMLTTNHLQYYATSFLSAKDSWLFVWPCDPLGHGEDIRVFALQPDIWAAPRSDVYLRFNMSRQRVASSLTDMSVCYRAYQTALTTLQVFLSYATADSSSNAIMMYVDDGEHFFRFNNQPQEAARRVRVPTELRRWRHYCHVLAGETYTVYVDGEVAASGPISGDDRVLPLNGSFIVGQEQDGFSRGMDEQQILKGYVTQVNLWDRGVSGAEVGDMASCRTNTKGNIFSTDRDDVELVNVQERNASLGDLCLREADFVIFPERYTYLEAEEFCRFVGSRMYAPRDARKMQMFNETKWKERLRFRTWLAITDEEEEGVWRRAEDGQALRDVAFAPGQPDNGKNENCIMSGGTDSLLNDFKCNGTIKGSVVCEDQTDVPLFLRGGCKVARTMTMFEIRGYVLQKPYFHGFHGEMILLAEEEEDERRKWLWLDAARNVTLASLEVASENVYPFGRRAWTLEAPVCDRKVGTTRVLSLSRCTDSEYMCADGNCIDIAARCDAKDDCADQTDEDDCDIVTTPPDYRKFKPPKNDLDPNLPLHPEAEVKFLRFHKIDDVQQVNYLEFILTLRWVDSRVTFFNLRSDLFANKLSASEREKIWTPELDFPNALNGDVKTVKTNFFIQRTGEPNELDFNNVNMDQTYSGSAATILLQTHYSGGFVCDFDVFFYPFDVQRCGVSIRLASVSKGQVRFTAVRSRARYGKYVPLPTYIVGNPVTYTLTRRYTLIVLSVFMPSILLLAIGYSTLYLKIIQIHHTRPLDLRVLALSSHLLAYDLCHVSLHQPSYQNEGKHSHFRCNESP
ncbi:hypothetical protein C7M84_009993 [Penaeus vannamei]|uniref:Pentraxin (PTX) domain-containing protein n=1 Tax=Penaeus vannamei TaxID=6689 RepID=A0A3R7MAU7_PENVA|nr:hypothetical protein C7M84_009993 [Penaeus vannamei]